MKYNPWICGLLSLLFAWSSSGCDRHSSSTSRSIDAGSFNAGNSLYGVVERSARQSANGERKVEVLRSPSQFAEETREGTHRLQIVDGVNSVFEGFDVTAGRAETSREDESTKKIFRSLYDLIREGTLPRLTDTLGAMLQEVGKDQKNIQIVADFLNTRSGIEPRAYVQLLDRILRYEKTPELLQALGTIIRDNPEMAKETLRALSDFLKSLPANEDTASLLKFLAYPVALNDNGPLGAPAWLSRIDANGNPSVCVDPDTKTLFSPFADKDGDGACDVGADGLPVNASGESLEIRAFSRKEYADAEGKTLVRRDSEGRALSPSGRFVFDYYDAKATLLGIAIYNLGEMQRRGIVSDALKVGAVALQPMKEHTDQQGPYMGYSDASEGLQAILGALDVAKSQKSLQLMRGFSLLIRHKLPTAQKFLRGFGKVIMKLRDEEIANQQQLMMRMMQMIVFGEIPEVREAINEMKAIEVPGAGKTMDMFFSIWLQEHIMPMACNVVWPARSILRKLPEAYPTDPQLAERLYYNVIELGVGDFAPGDRSLSPVLPIFLELLADAIAQDPEKMIGGAKDAVRTAVTSRWFVRFMECQAAFSQTPEARVLAEAMLHYLTPQSDPKLDVYGCLTCAVGLLQLPQDITPRIRLLNMLGVLLDPEQPVAMNLVQVVGKLAASENTGICLRSMRAAVAECEGHGLAPLVMFGHAVLAVQRVDYSTKHNSQFLPQDVQNLLFAFQDALLNPEGLVQRGYRALLRRR